MFTIVRPALMLAVAVPLAGCISFGPKPPPSLLTLNAAASVPVGEVTRSADTRTITISVPVVPQEIAVQRVPVRSTDTSIAYVKDAQWIEPPANLFARLLADTITSQTQVVVISSRQSLIDPGAALDGELRNFGVDAATGEAVVTYDAALTREGTPTIEKRRFEARVPVTPVEATPVGIAINQAANQVAGEVAAWVSGQPAQ